MNNKFLKKPSIYLVSLYYKKNIKTGANIRFEKTMKYFLKLGVDVNLVIAKNECPTGFDSEKVTFVPYSDGEFVNRIKSFLYLLITIKRISKKSIIITDFLPVISPFFKNHIVFQLIHDIRSSTKFIRKTGGDFTYHLQKYMFLNCKNIITVSNFSKNQLIKEMGIIKERIFVSYNGVEQKAFKTDNSKIIKDIDILYIATFEERKDHMTLLKAINELSHLNYKITFIGRDLGTLKTCKQFANNNSLDVKFVEKCSSKEIIEYYKKSKTYISPSLYEGFGMPLIEALESNCSLICSDLEVHREILKDNAVYFTPGNHLELKTIINKNLKNFIPEFKKNNSLKFSWENIFKKLLKELEIQYYE